MHQQSLALLTTLIMLVVGSFFGCVTDTCVYQCLHDLWWSYVFFRHQWKCWRSPKAAESINSIIAKSSIATRKGLALGSFAQWQDVKATVLNPKPFHPTTVGLHDERPPPKTISLDLAKQSWQFFFVCISNLIRKVHIFKNLMFLWYLFLPTHLKTKMGLPFIASKPLFKFIKIWWPIFQHGQVCTSF